MSDRTEPGQPTAAPPSRPDAELTEAEIAESVASYRGQFESFSKENGIRPLTDRVRRGLNEAAVLALGETRLLVQELASRLGADEAAVLKMTLDIQGGGPWAYAKSLSEAEDPVARVWMIVNASTTIGREREMDLLPRELCADVARVKALLAEAAADPEAFFPRAKAHVLEESKKLFRVEDGVPVTQVDNGFVAMAVNGHEAGIWQDADGMLFVGAKAIDERSFEAWGLERDVREDRGRPDIPFYLNDKGEALFKRVHPGFAVVLSRNFALAKAIAKAAASAESAPPPKEALAHLMFEPTSAQRKGEDEEKRESDRLSFLRPKADRGADAPPSSETGLVRLKDRLFSDMAFVKSHVILIDAVEKARAEKAAKGKELTAKEVDKLHAKIPAKVEQKMEELKFMADIIDRELARLPEGTDVVMDMAGGVGDLGLATGTYMRANGMPVSEIRIVDPFNKQEGFASFTDMIIDFLPFKDDLRTATRHTDQPVQEAEITSDAVVVAKHACGDLTDSIIEKWVESDSPLLVAMTCCQDKAKDNPARYGLTQEEWSEACRLSAKTNSQKPEDRAEGMRAMLKLDHARVAYLKRHGFEVEFHTTDEFPKGDVIVARRRKPGS